ncbi:MAG: ABC transporter permease [Flavobacteriales bacterium]
MNLLRLAIKNIVHRKLTSALSILLLAAGISIMTLLLLTNHQLQNKFNKNVEGIDLVVGAKGSRLQLVLCNIFHIDNPTGNIKLKETQFISKHPFVKSAIPLSLGDNYKNFRIVGTSPKYIEHYKAKIAKGHIWEKPLEVVIGAGVKAKTKLKIGSHFAGGHGLAETVHSHDEFEYEVVGILESTGSVLDNLILTSIESVWVVHAGHDHESEGSFDLKSKEEVEENFSVVEAKKLAEILKNADSSTSEIVDVVEIGNAENKNHDHHGHNHHHHAHFTKEQLDSIVETIPFEKREITSMLVVYANPRAKFTIPGGVNANSAMIAAEPPVELMQLTQLISPGITLLRYMAIFIVIIAGLSVFIALFNSLKDRRYEIALLRVMGATRLTVFVAVLTEGVVLSMLGYILGFLVSHFGMQALGGYLSKSYNYDFEAWIILPQEGIIFALAIAIGLVSSLLPAIKAYKTDISTTLSQS